MVKTLSTRRTAGVLGLLAAQFLSGCQMAVLDPKGSIGADEKSLIITATLLMLLVVVPVIVLTLVFAWRYRASNTEARYEPNWHHSNAIEAIVWAVPCVIILILGTITWNSTHDLDPRAPIAGTEGIKPIEVEVVALDWKWLFIYPEQHVASVNELAFPKDVPVHFKLTSDTVMNAFFIPQLGSQVYAMAGMQQQLNLIANHEGVYDGMSTNFSGEGFSDMKFKAHVTSRDGFDQWVKKAQASGKTLNFDEFRQLSRPSQKVAVSYYSTVEPVLFSAVVDKYMDKTTGLGAADKLCLPVRQQVAKASE